MPRREDMPYRDCVGVAVFNREGKVFIGRRKPDHDPEDSSELGSPWQMPQGGIDDGEAPEVSALRELYEETSIRSVNPLDEIKSWIYYDLPDDMLGIALKGKYRGQRQRWFAYLFTGSDEEIDVLNPGGGSHPAEFDKWRWEALETLPEIIVPFKRKAYEEIVARFRELPAKVRAGGR
jgi:putative (di)nucleoside polyphosphate hydrolase